MSSCRTSAHVSLLRFTNSKKEKDELVNKERSFLRSKRFAVQAPPQSEIVEKLALLQNDVHRRVLQTFIG